MWISQTYSRPSAAQTSDDAMNFSLSAQEGRPVVKLSAKIKNSPSYARAMLALFEVVSGDQRFHQKDHTDYQNWVRGEYLRELGPQLAARRARVPAQTARRDELKEQLKTLENAARPLRSKMHSTDLWEAKRRYWQWLYKRDHALWVILDPVVSVHPDATIFEVFSQDESSYGRVTVASENLETSGETVFGTTNVDFSQALANEIRRVRSYRPAHLEVGGGGVSIGTEAGERLEKKIDLPPTWVRGFLQVQSAATLPHVALTLSASTVAEILMILGREREKVSPRALRFVLKNGEKPRVFIEPWNIEIEEHGFVFEGEDQEIRIWGRRRLEALSELLPHAEKVEIQLLGTGMPSFWSVEADGHRFDLGLSGWTKNDWSSAARFDLLASVASVSQGDIELARGQLEKALKLTPDELAARSDLGREAATAALQQICKDGDAMFDIIEGFYRWRKLLPPGVEAQKPARDPKVENAIKIVKAGGVKFEPTRDEDFLSDARGESTRMKAQVSTLGRDGSTRGGHKFDVTLHIDADGRANFASCSCSDFRRDKLKKGPCGHILAVAALASGQVLQAKTARAAGQTAAAINTEKFKDQLFCFTGALKIYSRDQAETLVAQFGGKAASDVSKNLTYLVAGEKAGSKLIKARLLGVKILSEDEFKTMIES